MQAGIKSTRHRNRERERELSNQAEKEWINAWRRKSKPEMVAVRCTRSVALEQSGRSAATLEARGDGSERSGCIITTSTICNGSERRAAAAAAMQKGKKGATLDPRGQTVASKANS